MLVLTRKKFEMIQIGDDIVIKIIHTSRKTVKLGIEAPAHVRVLRGELCPEAAQPAMKPTLTTLIAQRRARIEVTSNEPLTTTAK